MIVHNKPTRKTSGDLCHGPESRVHGLVQAILLMLLRESEDHGYRLVQRLGAEIPREMIPAPAVVYRMLRELERLGSVQAALQPGEGGPARKVYSLTASGKRQLAEWKDAIRHRIGILEQFLQRYREVSATDEKEGDS